MRWTKLKQKVESRFADSVRGRVQIGSTQYRKPRSEGGRGWIRVDGEEIANFSTVDSGQIHGSVFHETSAQDYPKHAGPKSEDRAEGNLVERGEFSRYDLHEACFTALNLGIDDALSSHHPLIQALAVLDRRLGKRRLRADDLHLEHPLPRFLLQLRRRAEGVSTPPEAIGAS